MNIKTKCNIGDKVFAIFKSIQNDKWYMQDKKFTIKEIKIDKNLDVYYSLITDGFWIFTVFEKFCFKTKAEAQAECNRRNNEEI